MTQWRRFEDLAEFPGRWLYMATRSSLRKEIRMTRNAAPLVNVHPAWTALLVPSFAKAGSSLHNWRDCSRNACEVLGVGLAPIRVIWRGWPWYRALPPQSAPSPGAPVH